MIKYNQILAAHWPARVHGVNSDTYEVRLQKTQAGCFPHGETERRDHRPDTGAKVQQNSVFEVKFCKLKYESEYYIN